MTDSDLELDPVGRPVPRTTADLVARVEEGWAPTRTAIARIAAAGLEMPTSAGWTYRAIVLHIAAWHELTVRRLASWLETGQHPGPVDVDAFNAKVATEASTLTDAEVVHRLDGSYRAFLAAVRSLPGDRLTELDGWPVVVVAGNSYGHYAEHGEELGIE